MVCILIEMVGWVFAKKMNLSKRSLVIWEKSFPGRGNITQHGDSVTNRISKRKAQQEMKLEMWWKLNMQGFMSPLKILIITLNEMGSAGDYWTKK